MISCICAMEHYIRALNKLKLIHILLLGTGTGTGSFNVAVCCAVMHASFHFLFICNEKYTVKNIFIREEQKLK